MTRQQQADLMRQHLVTRILARCYERWDDDPKWKLRAYLLAYGASLYQVMTRT